MRWWHRWRRKRTLQRRAIPDSLWALTLAQFPFLARCSVAQQIQLREMSTLFLADKEFAGMQGLQVDDAMAVAIAAQACLPVLQLGLHRYDGFKGIVVHPDVVVARREHMDDDGVVHQYDEELSGEAMHGGPVMLSWRDVAEAGETADWGYNVVIHEFVHVIDQREGISHGSIDDSAGATRNPWQADLAREFDSFQDAIDAGEPVLMDPYGAESIEEFFAVASEMFFVAPTDLRGERPTLYALLMDFFRQDPVTSASTAESGATPLRA